MDDHDKEYAYKRGLEIVDEIEGEIVDKLGGRQRCVPGPWLYPREIILAQLRVNLYDSPLRGLHLDRYLRRFFSAVANGPIVVRPEAAGQRQPAFSRQDEREVEEDFRPFELPA